MASVAEIKNKALSNMAKMDIEGMSLADLSAYVDILRRISEISEKPYMETLLDTMHKGFSTDNPLGALESTGLALGLAGGGINV